MKIKALVLASSVAVLSSGFSHAMETTPSGQLQAQVSYDSGLRDWDLTMPESYIGLRGVETLSTGTLSAFWLVGVDPLADDPQATLSQEQGYLQWRQSSFGVWAGRLPSLEQTYVIDLVPTLYSFSNSGLLLPIALESTENSAIRLDYAADQNSSFSAQVVLDEATDESLWSAAYILSTSEGTLSLTYRNVPNSDPIWGTQVVVDLPESTFSGTWFYQDDLVSWSVAAVAKFAGGQSVFSYTVLEDEKRWSVGLNWALSTNANGYSEVSWWTNDEHWQWSSGVQLKF